MQETYTSLRLATPRFARTSQNGFALYKFPALMGLKKWKYPSNKQIWPPCWTYRLTKDQYRGSIIDYSLFDPYFDQLFLQKNFFQRLYDRLLTSWPLFWSSISAKNLIQRLYDRLLTFWPLFWSTFSAKKSYPEALISITHFLTPILINFFCKKTLSRGSMKDYSHFDPYFDQVFLPKNLIQRL